MPIPFQRKLRIQFLKWHRSIGLFAALFIIIIVATGILLNHGNDLELDHAPVPRSFLGLYGVAVEPPTTGYPVKEQWVSEAHGNLYLNTDSVGRCGGSLVGALSVDDGILAVCQDDIYLLTHDAQVIEKLSQLQQPIQKLGKIVNNVILKTPESLHQFDTDEFSFVEFEAFSEQKIEWLKSDKLPDRFASMIESEMVVSEITWERLLLDLHSGRLFGNVGVFIVDLIGIVMLLLALSGVWLRLSRPGKK